MADNDTEDPRRLKCPACGNVTDLDEYDGDEDVLQGGTHDVKCYGCGRSFEILTTIDWKFETTDIVREEDGTTWSPASP